MIAYAADTTSEFEIGTVATHSCNAGFALVGDMTRNCMDDDQADIVGVWSGSASTCECKDFKFSLQYTFNVILLFIFSNRVSLLKHYKWSDCVCC